MVTTFNSNFTTSSLISNPKNILEEEKSQVLRKKSVSISLQTHLLQKPDNKCQNEQSNNIITKIEEVKSLQLNTDSIQQEILNLELRSIIKMCKIEDLRNIIERISEEDYYFDRTLDHKRYFNFVKSFSYSSSNSKKKQCYNVERRASGDVCTRTISSESSQTTDTTGTTDEGEGEKHGRASQSCICNNIDDCLLYWSSAFPVSNKKAIHI